MKALLLDVGNSRLKWGVLDNGSIRRTGHIAQDTIQQQGLSALTSKLPRQVDAVFASNVAGTTYATRLSGVLSLHCNCDMRFARTEKEGFGLTNSYRQPRRMGVDRWVAMIGAWSEIEAACIVVDAGTAVTIDAVDDGGQHLGGQIFPGATLMAEVMANKTHGIPDVGHRVSKAASGLEMFANNTARAVEQGVMNAVAGAIERAAWAMSEMSSDPTIVLTGGDASRILKSLEEEPLHRPHLVLQGLAHILESRQ